MATEPRFLHHRAYLAKARRMIFFLFGLGQPKVLTSGQGQVRAPQVMRLVEGGHIAYHLIRQVFQSPFVAFSTP